MESTDQASHSPSGDTAKVEQQNGRKAPDASGPGQRGKKRAAPGSQSTRGAAPKDNARARNRKTEQERRDRIHGGLKTLRDVLPMVHSKMDQQQLLRHAARYIVTVQALLRRADAVGALVKWPQPDQDAFRRLINPQPNKPADAIETLPPAALPIHLATAASWGPAVPLRDGCQQQQRGFAQQICPPVATSPDGRDSVEGKEAKLQPTLASTGSAPSDPKPGDVRVREREALGGEAAALGASGRRMSLDMSSHGSHHHQSGSGGSMVDVVVPAPLVVHDNTARHWERGGTMGNLDAPAPSRMPDNTAQELPAELPSRGMPGGASQKTRSSPEAVQEGLPLTVAYADGCIRQSQSLPIGVSREALFQQDHTLVYVREPPAPPAGRALRDRVKSMDLDHARSAGGQSACGKEAGHRGDRHVTPRPGHAEGDQPSGSRSLGEKVSENCGGQGGPRQGTAHSTVQATEMQPQEKQFSGFHSPQQSSQAVQSAGVRLGEQYGRSTSLTRSHYGPVVTMIGPPGPPAGTPAPRTSVQHPLFTGSASAAMVHQYYPLPMQPRVSAQWSGGPMQYSHPGWANQSQWLNMGPRQGYPMQQGMATNVGRDVGQSHVQPQQAPVGPYAGSFLPSGAPTQTAQPMGSMQPQYLYPPGPPGGGSGVMHPGYPIAYGHPMSYGAMPMYPMYSPQTPISPNSHMGQAYAAYYPSQSDMGNPSHQGMTEPSQPVTQSSNPMGMGNPAQAGLGNPGHAAMATDKHVGMPESSQQALDNPSFPGMSNPSYVGMGSPNQGGVTSPRHVGMHNPQLAGERQPQNMQGYYSAHGGPSAMVGGLGGPDGNVPQQSSPRYFQGGMSSPAGGRGNGAQPQQCTGYFPGGMQNGVCGKPGTSQYVPPGYTTCVGEPGGMGPMLQQVPGGGKLPSEDRLGSHSYPGNVNFAMEYDQPATGQYGMQTPNPGQADLSLGGFAPQHQGECYTMQMNEGGGQMQRGQGQPEGQPTRVMQQDGTRQAGTLNNCHSGQQTTQMLQSSLLHQESLPDGLFQMLSGMGQGPDSVQVSPGDAPGSANPHQGQGQFMPAVSDDSFPFGSFHGPGRWGAGLSNNFLPDLPNDLTDEQAESRSLD